MNPHSYLPHTEADIARMLTRCGASSLDDFYSDVAQEMRLAKPYDICPGMSEPELEAYMRRLASANRELVCFAGGGFYHHHTPAAVEAITSRSEFLTAYTPYQPEISQGTLQYIFEYQSMMAELTGLDVSNASMYDGSTATAEAMIMAVAAARKKRRILLSATVNPAVADVVGTYAAGAGISVEIIPEYNGITDRNAFIGMLRKDDIAGVIVASPNYYGILEDYSGWADECHARKALLIMNCHASALAVIRTPGAWGADIACGEAQSLGIPLNYGGPGLGYLCARRELMRKMPGRIVGATTDADGKRVFVLTLQAREQHIRRQKATSNICSNQGLMTLHAAAYLSLMGAKGLAEVNSMGCDAAHSLASKLTATGRMKPLYPNRPFLNEVAMKIAAPLTADRIINSLADAGILAGIKLDDDAILIAATEMCSPADIDRYVQLVNNL